MCRCACFPGRDRVATHPQNVFLSLCLFKIPVDFIMQRNCSNPFFFPFTNFILNLHNELSEHGVRSNKSFKKFDRQTWELPPFQKIVAGIIKKLGRNLEKLLCVIASLAELDLKKLPCALFLLSHGSATHLNSEWFPLLERNDLIPACQVAFNVPDDC